MTDQRFSDLPSDPKPGTSEESRSLGSLFEKFALEESAMPMGPKSFDAPEGKLIGDDIESVQDHWDGRQSEPDTCAIRCQEYLIELYSGKEIDEYDLIREAHEKGWYTPGCGTPKLYLGNLLEEHGIEIHRYERSNIFHLADELGQGHKVIVGVDGQELFHRMPLFHNLKDALGLDGADHAVIVSGIDTTEPGNPQVIVTDPGTGEAAARYPLDQFVEAWRDSDFTMIATAKPPSVENCPEMVNFGTDEYRSMLFRVAGMPYLDYLYDLWQETGEPGDFPYGESDDESITSPIDAKDGEDMVGNQMEGLFDSFADPFDLGGELGEYGDEDDGMDETM